MADLDSLRDMITSEDIDTRKQAVMALGESDDPGAVDLLLEASQDSELSVRYFARKSLKKLKKRLDIREEELESNLENVYISRQMTNLADDDPKIRTQAALKLAEFKDPELLPKIIEQLQQEEHKHVIATLVKTIGILGDESVIPVLSPWLKDTDSRVRANTIEALEAVQVAKTFELISPLLNDTNSRVVANAAKTLWHFSRLKALTRLREMMRNSDVDVRKSAVFALGEIGSVETRRLLAKMLNDQDMDVRLQASMAIGKVDEKLSRKETESPLAASPPVPPAGKIGELPESTAPIAAAPPPEPAAAQPVTEPTPEPVPQEEAKPPAAPAAARLDTIIKDLDSEDEEVRVRAVQNAGELGDTSVLQLLEDRLSLETSRYVIATLVKAVGSMGGTDTVEQIVPFLDYPDPRVRANAVEGLAMANDPELSRHIAPLLGDPDNRVRGNVATHLWKNDPDIATSKIDKMLSSPSVWDRESALYAIERIKDPALVPQLKKLLKDKSLTIVRKAATLLGTLEDSPAPARPPSPAVKRPVAAAPQPVQAAARPVKKAAAFAKTVFFTVVGIVSVGVILGSGFYFGHRMAAKNKDKLPVKVTKVVPVKPQPEQQPVAESVRKPPPRQRPAEPASRDISKHESGPSGTAEPPPPREQPRSTGEQPAKTTEPARQPVTGTVSEAELTFEEALAMRDIFGDDSIPLPPQEEAVEEPGPPDKTPVPPVVTGLVFPRILPSPPDTGAPATDSGKAPESSELKDKAFAHMDRGEYDPAIELFQKAAETNPQDTEALYYIGHLLLQSRKYREAVTYFDRTLEVDKHYVDARFMKGRAYFMLGQNEPAIKSYQAGLAMRPDDISAMRELARIHEHRGKNAEAAAVIEKAVEYSDSPNLKYRLGQIYQKMGQAEKVKTLAEAVMKQDPNAPHGYNLLGEYYLAENDLDQASQLLEKGLQLRETPEGHKLLAQIHLTRHAYGTARQHLNHVVTYSPNDDWALFNRGRILRLFGDLDGAIPDLERALDLNPNDIPTQAHLADCYLLKKKFGEAADLYQRALDLAPAHNIATELKERLSLARSKRVPGSLPSVW